MDRETFYRKLIQALHNSGFVLRASDLSKEEMFKDLDSVSAAVRAAAQYAPGLGEIHPVFDQAVVQPRLDKLHEWATLVALKYVLAQPVILAVVEADQLTQEASIGMSKRLDEVVVAMLDVTATLEGAKIGGFQLLKGTRLGATGIILNVFFQHSSALTFVERTQKKCKILHLFKKTWVLPWAVDVSNKNIISHRGLPFLSGVINCDDLRNEMFQ